MIKTFRRSIETTGQHTIRLSTNDGMIGYRIKKFQVIAYQPGTAEIEAVLQIWINKQTAASSTIDFDNSELLAAAEYREFAAAEDYSSPQTVIFDNVVFNQDIYITCKNAAGANKSNYYLELEQVKLDLGEATVATLKDMRGTN